MYYRTNSNWGTHLWNYIHNITIIDFEYPEDNKRFSEIAYDILKNLKFPCKKCQIEYENQINEIDTILFTKSMYLFEWSWKFHNKINEKLNKPTIAYEEALKIHTNQI